MQKAIKVRGLKRISVFRVFDFARKKNAFLQITSRMCVFFLHHIQR